MASTPPSPKFSPQPQRLMENLAGVIDIMLGRTSGLSRIDLSASGIGWSFGGLAIAGLADMSALSMLYNGQAAQESMEVSKAFYVIGHLVVSLIGYAASFVALYLLCRTPGEQQNFPTAVAVHNWASPIVSIAFVPLLAIAFSLGGTGGSMQDNTLLNMVSVFWIGVLIFIGLRLIRISLNIQMGKTVLFFVVSTAVSLITVEGLESLLGLTRAS